MSSFLAPYQNAELTLSQLTDAARALLSRSAAGPSDDRVQTFPDARTIRYYQSLGVVDKPLRYQGRQAIYGYRHLLQAVAVKLLQARGFSLAQAQGALRGAPTSQLEAAAIEGLGGTPPPGGEPAAPLAAPPSAPLAPRSLVSAELLPGVTVTVDPSVVDDPAALLQRIAQTLSTPEST